MLLSFIDDNALFGAVEKVISTLQSARSKSDSQLFKNTIDPFSGLFDSALQNIGIDEWLSQERSRQIQKTFQNAIGNFHQNIIGSMTGWEDLGVGSLLDVRSESKKAIAEIKNKFNTTKGNHRMQVYDDIESALSLEQNSGFTGYYVEILSKSKSSYNKPFTPSDNSTHSRRPVNEQIRVISGQLFYDLASGEEETLKRLYLVLPGVISEITKIPERKITHGMSSLDLFYKAF